MSVQAEIFSGVEEETNDESNQDHTSFADFFLFEKMES